MQTVRTAAGEVAITLLPPAAQKIFIEQLTEAIVLPGDFAELGVYRGGSAQALARNGAGRTVHLFDTFSGAPHREKFHKPGDFADTSEEYVRGILDGQGFNNFVLYPGLFPATAEAVPPETRFAFVHLDGDFYQSTLDGLKWFYPRMVKGGIILLDDYYRNTCPGVERASMEFLADKKERLEILGQREAQARIVKL